jgi:hypothetical protein
MSLVAPRLLQARAGVSSNASQTTAPDEVEASEPADGQCPYRLGEAGVTRPVTRTPPRRPERARVDALRNARSSRNAVGLCMSCSFGARRLAGGPRKLGQRRAPEQRLRRVHVAKCGRSAIASPVMEHRLRARSAAGVRDGDFLSTRSASATAALARTRSHGCSESPTPTSRVRAELQPGRRPPLHGGCAGYVRVVTRGARTCISATAHAL